MLQTQGMATCKGGHAFLIFQAAVKPARVFRPDAGT